MVMAGGVVVFIHGGKLNSSFCFFETNEPGSRRAADYINIEEKPRLGNNNDKPLKLKAPLNSTSRLDWDFNTAQHSPPRQTRTQPGQDASFQSDASNEERNACGAAAVRPYGQGFYPGTRYTTGKRVERRCFQGSKRCLETSPSSARRTGKAFATTIKPTAHRKL